MPGVPSNERGRYDKPVADDDALLVALRERGLLIDDTERALRYLRSIGYYRLSGYLSAFEPGTKSDGTRDHALLPGTTFQQVLDLYVFDRKLRILVMEAMERVEVALRASWANALARATGNPHAWLDSRQFKPTADWFTQAARVVRVLDQSREPFVAHYRNRYGQPEYPPIWAMVETLSFGELSRWLSMTLDPSVGRRVSSDLHLMNPHIARQTFECLSHVRNVCAHHGRAWDRLYIKEPPRLKRLQHDLVDAPTTQEQDGHRHPPKADRHLYNYLVILADLLNHLNPRSTWRARVLELVGTRPSDQRARMHVPEDWASRPVWTLPSMHAARPSPPA